MHIRVNTCNTKRIISVSSGGKAEKGGAANTFQAYQASVSDAWDIEVSGDNCDIVTAEQSG